MTNIRFVGFNANFRFNSLKTRSNSFLRRDSEDPLYSVPDKKHPAKPTSPMMDAFDQIHQDMTLQLPTIPTNNSQTSSSENPDLASRRDMILSNPGEQVVTVSVTRRPNQPLG